MTHYSVKISNETKEGKIMGRYITCMLWGMIFMFIVGFIGAPLTQNTYHAVPCLIFGAIFGLLFALIIPRITANSYKDNSKYSK